MTKNKKNSSFEFQKSNGKKTTVYNDEELQMLINNDNYICIKRVKQVFVLVIIAIVLFLTICILTNMYDLQIFFVEKLKENFTAIIFFVLALFGIRNTKN